jgi:hypothetical protein
VPFEWVAYQGIADKDTLHATVNHFQKEYVRGIVHTNTLECLEPFQAFDHWLLPTSVCEAS